MADKFQATSDLLYELRADGARIDELPPHLTPRSEAEAYQVQALVEARSAAPLFGWKIAATSPAGQAHINVDGPLAGRILKETVIEDGGTCILGTNLMRVAELEFAFRMGATLAPRDDPHTVREVVNAVASLHPAIEIPDTRLTNFAHVGAPQLIADNACANRFLLGAPASEDWRGIDLAAFEVEGFLNGQAFRRGIGRNVLGDPRLALAWLANRVSALGLPLRQGQVVTTGVCMIPIDIAPRDHVAGDFGRLGRVSISFG